MAATPEGRAGETDRRAVHTRHRLLPDSLLVLEIVVK